MAVKIRLTRMGKIRKPFYRVVVADSRTRRDGRAIEEIGVYHPTENPSVIKIDSERAQYWLSVGAQPTDQVKALLKLTGDWGKSKGEPKTLFRHSLKRKLLLLLKLSPSSRKRLLLRVATTRPKSLLKTQQLRKLQLKKLQLTTQKRRLRPNRVAAGFGTLGPRDC